MRYQATLAGAMALWICAVSAPADWKDDIGYTQLVDELAAQGLSAPTGAGVTVSHVEATDQEGDYAPSTSDSQFVGKSFTLKSGASGVSTHATTVGRYLYGNITGMAPDINTIDNWQADHWLGDGFLKLGGGDPRSETRRIQNHSWIGNYPGDAIAAEAIQRFDYTIHQDNYVAVAGMNNGSSTTIPDLLGHSYNAIAVGRSDGRHSHGFTRFDTPGRIKPDLVVPQSATSWATPVVGSAAAMLLEMSDDDPALAGAGNCEAVKAILLAGATKGEFPAWDRTHARPLDDVYGAGELNVYRSHQVISGGEQEAGPSALVSSLGWDFDTVSASGQALHFFDVGEANFLDELSVVLAWNREITDQSPSPVKFIPSITLAELDLELWTADGFVLGERLDYSASTVDNVEHIYADNLSAGRYAMRVLCGDTGGQYALAWYGRDLLRGDVNGDGSVDNLDITPFVEAASGDKATFLSLHPEGAYWAADVNADGNVDNLDITPFVDMLAGGAAAAPEPAAAALMLCAVPALLRRKPARRRKAGKPSAAHF